MLTLLALMIVPAFVLGYLTALWDSRKERATMRAFRATAIQAQQAQMNHRNQQDQMNRASRLDNPRTLS